MEMFQRCGIVNGVEVGIKEEVEGALKATGAYYMYALKEVE